MSLWSSLVADIEKPVVGFQNTLSLIKGFPENLSVLVPDSFVLMYLNIAFQLSISKFKKKELSLFFRRRHTCDLYVCLYLKNSDKFILIFRDRGLKNNIQINQG